MSFYFFLFDTSSKIITLFLFNEHLDYVGELFKFYMTLSKQQLQDACVLVQFYPWFKLYFPLFWGMVMYDNEFKTKGNKTWTKEKIEPQHMQWHEENGSSANEQHAG